MTGWAGAAIEVRLTPRLSIEVDGMYRLLHITWAGVLPDGSLNSVSPSPVGHLGSFRCWPSIASVDARCGRLSRVVRPFRTTGNLNFNPSHYGVTAGGGFETDWKGFTISPMVRYTRWAEEKTYGGPRGDAAQPGGTAGEFPAAGRSRTSGRSGGVCRLAECGATA